jgi:hypothetical protein
MLMEAVAELDATGLIQISGGVGYPDGQPIRAKWPLLWLLEPDHLDDARTLSRLALDESSLMAWRLADRLNWSPRRVNAAMEIIQLFAPSGHVSRAANPAFSVFSVSIEPATRMRLRRFISDTEEGAQV